MATHQLAKPHENPRVWHNAAARGGEIDEPVSRRGRRMG
jgi:hypothetical protein